jgi:hypothetical protein
MADRKFWFSTRPTASPVMLGESGLTFISFYCIGDVQILQPNKGSFPVHLPRPINCMFCVRDCDLDSPRHSSWETLGSRTLVFTIFYIYESPDLGGILIHILLRERIVLLPNSPKA